MKEKMSLESTTSSIGDALWNLRDQCEQFKIEYRRNRKDSVFIELRQKNIEGNHFKARDTKRDVEWSYLIFLDLKFLIWREILNEDDYICLFMKQYPMLKVPSFQSPLVGNGFSIVASENGQLSVDITDYSKARAFVDAAPTLSEVSQNTLTLLIAAAILSVPVAYFTGVQGSLLL